MKKFLPLTEMWNCCEPYNTQYDEQTWSKPRKYKESERIPLYTAL